MGGYIGHSNIHPDLIETANKKLAIARENKKIIDFCVMRCGDDLELIMTHNYGVGSEDIYRFAWDTFIACTEVAKRLKLYGAGQDILNGAFSGTVKGIGPGVAELEFEERKSEPIIMFMADKTSAGA